MTYHHLATSFNRKQGIQRVRPLTDDELRQAVPSIYADDAHESRSSRYVWVPTANIVRALRREGWEPFLAVQARTRDKSREGHTKHMLRLRRPADIGQGEAPEVILVNSHDGSCSYQLFAGVLRFVCTNSLIVGSSFENVRVPHKGNIEDNVIEGVFTVAREFPKVYDQVKDFQVTTLSRDEQQAFAEAALIARYGEEKPPLKPDQLLKARREEDSAGDLWTTFNKVQEHMVRGGLHGIKRNEQGRIRHARTRAINGIDQNVQLNRALWTLSDHMRKLKNG